MKYKLETIPRQSFKVRLLNRLAYMLELISIKLRKKALDSMTDFEFYEPSLGSGIRDVGQLPQENKLPIAK